MLRGVRSERSDLYFLKLPADSGGRTEETPPGLLEAKEVDVVSRQPAEQQLECGRHLPPPHPRLPDSHQALPPRPLLLPQPQHQPRQRAQSHLCSSFRTQQPQIGRGQPQRASAQTAGTIPVSFQLTVAITFLESNIL